MTNRTLTAMYDTRSAAENARDQLAEIGIACHAVSIRGTERSSAETSDPATKGRGFWGSLADLFMPDEDRHTYAEGLERGSYLLAARVSDDLEAAAADILEGSEPIDLDERSATWRQDGWTGYHMGASPDAGAPAIAAYGEGAGLAEAHPGFATEATTVSARQESPRDSWPTLGVSAAKAFARADNDVVQIAEEGPQVGKRDVGRSSVRVRSYVRDAVREQEVGVEDDQAPREPTGTGTVVENSVVDPDLAGTSR